MRAIRVHETGGPEVLRVDTVPDPTPGAGEVLIDVEAIGVNFIEIYQREGWYQLPRPFILGAEGAGLRPNTREHCDALARLPITDVVESLNVSNAAAVALYAAAIA